MARPLKQGIDYFPVDTTEDDELLLLEAETGLEGHMVFIKLLKSIYSNGYYIEWNETREKLFSRRFNVDINTTSEVVNVCINIGLFDEKRYKEYGILTSHGIQKRFFNAITRRKKVYVNNNYMLVDINDYINPQWTEVITNIGTQSKVKQSKVKQSSSNTQKPELKPVDNSKPEPAPEEVRAAAAVLNLQLKNGDAAAASRALAEQNLDAAFITWASGELKTNEKIKNPAGLLRKMLLSLDDYGDWIARYRATHTKPSPPTRAAPPGQVCPHCGGAVRAIGDELWCGSCKRLLWEYDADFDIWTEVMEKADVAGW